ncbi:MAG: L-threonylcarbamoyladenylate synthase [Peptococcaceae bacterium]|nr:L-threonylcarbamoyladenylate synthase [Peptococcaceae bacterium]
METRRHNIDINADPATWREVLEEGAKLLGTGELVAFPTETVYGLGANAWDADACGRIFRVKGRPGDNPLIVHVASAAAAREIVACWPEQAAICTARFWPGPLTLVLPKNPAIPPVVTGGGETVAVRVPGHPVARALIERAACPVAAPSANMSGRPSPTLADHVWEDLAGKIPLIIDGGPCGVGVESTVLDLCDKPVILRPGGVSWEALEEVLGEVDMGEGIVVGLTEDHKALPRSPGMKYRHYAPRAPISILAGTPEARIRAIVAAVGAKKAPLALLCFARTAGLLAPQILDAVDYVRVFPENDGMREGAAGLFAALRACDQKEIALILAEACERTQLGLTYMNRLEKAALDCYRP